MTMRKRAFAAARWGGCGTLLALFALLLPTGAVSQVLPTVEQEIIEDFRRSVFVGYQECSVEKVLEMYDSRARVATFTRGVLDKEAFAALLREFFGQNKKMEVALEFGPVGFEGEEALVPFRLVVTGTGPDGAPRVTSDRLYCRIRKHGTWKILTQTYRKDFTLPPDTGAPAVHH